MQQTLPSQLVIMQMPWCVGWGSQSSSHQGPVVGFTISSNHLYPAMTKLPNYLDEGKSFHLSIIWLLYKIHTFLFKPAKFHVSQNYLVFSTWHKLHQHLAQQAQCGQTLWDHCCHWAVIDMCSEMKKWSKPMVRQPLFTLCSPIMGQLQSGWLREGPPWEFASHHVFGSLNRQIAHLLLSVSSWGIEEGSANPRK